MVSWSDFITSAVQDIPEFFFHIVFDLLLAVSGSRQKNRTGGCFCAFYSFRMIVRHFSGYADGKHYPEWTSCTLQDAVDFLDGQRKPLESADRARRQGIYPYYGASGIIDCIDDYIFDEPLLLLGEDGANIINRSTPLCFIATGKYWVNNHAHVMRPKKGHNIKFLCELLESLDYTRYNTGTAQPTALQNRLTEFAGKYPSECRLIDDDGNGCLTFEVSKGRFGFKLTAPYDENRRKAASELAKKNTERLRR